MTKASGWWVPPHIKSMKDLSISQKVLLGRLLSLSANPRGGCWAKNETLARDLEVTERHVQRLLARLKAAGLVEETITGKRRVRGNKERLLKPTGAAISHDSLVVTDAPECRDRRAYSHDSLVVTHDEKREVDKTAVGEQTRARAQESPAAAAASSLSLERRLERLLASETGRKGGEARSITPVGAALPTILPPPGTSAPVDTSTRQESECTASEEERAAATELGLRGIDAAEPLRLAKKHGLARVLEVCRWSDRQRWKDDLARRPREIVCALREGYGTAPLEGSEAAAGLARDAPRSPMHPWEELPPIDAAYRRYLRGEQTLEERRREEEERAAIAELKARLGRAPS